MVIVGSRKGVAMYLKNSIGKGAEGQKYVFSHEVSLFECFCWLKTIFLIKRNIKELISKRHFSYLLFKKYLGCFIVPLKKRPFQKGTQSRRTLIIFPVRGLTQDHLPDLP